MEDTIIPVIWFWAAISSRTVATNAIMMERAASVPACSLAARNALRTVIGLVLFFAFR